MSVRSKRRTWLLRGLAVLFGLLPIALLECGLRIFDLPKQRPAIDPFVDLHNLKPIFEPEADGAIMRMGRERLNLFRDASFQSTKPPGQFRVFALGGSTTQGEPYSTDTAFPKWLELSLHSMTSGRDIQVVNCGGLSYASYRVSGVLKEVLQFEPDLIVLYCGHNEFLERRSYEGLRSASSLTKTLSSLQSLRIVQLGKNLLGREGSRPDPLVRDPTELAAEVDALLDYQGGLEEYRRDDDWHAPVTEHYRWNMQQMVDLCDHAKVPLIVCKPASNLKDCPPIKFESDPAATPENRQAFETFFTAAREASDQQSAYESIEAALQLDANHAGANYFKGQILLSRGDYAEAEIYLRRARDYDVCPLRAPEYLTRVLDEICDQEQIPYLDPEQEFLSTRNTEILGEEWLVDHIHPTIEGHQLLGVALAEKVLEMKLVKLKNATWKQDLDDVFPKHLAGLGEENFHRGKQRLEGLILWTQGRAKKTAGAAKQ